MITSLFSLAAELLRDLVISIEKVRPLVVAITSSAMPTKLNVADILSERMLSQEDQATTSSSRSGSSRKILEASSVGAAKELVVGVHMSPGVMGGTLAGVFLLATLWISVSCFFTIESAPMMVRWFCIFFKILGSFLLYSFGCERSL